jgi:hypothetical protein
VAEVLDQHVTLEVECIDRMYLNVYMPQLQHVGGAVQYIRYHLKQPWASTALIAPISRKFVESIERFIEENHIPVVEFRRGQRKDEVAKERLAQFGQDEGIVFVGKAQEKATVFPTEKRRNPQNRPKLSLDRAIFRDGQSLLLLRCGSGLRPVLFKVLQLLPL